MKLAFLHKLSSYICCVGLDPKDVIISDLRRQLQEKDGMIFDLRERLARCHCKPASTGYSTPIEDLSNKQLNRIVLPIVKVKILTLDNCGIVQIWVASELLGLFFLMGLYMNIQSCSLSKAVITTFAFKRLLSV